MRNKDQLDQLGIKFPDDRRYVIEMSQSEANIYVASTGTITPQGTYWLAWKARTLHGVEPLHIQGIFIPEYARSWFSDKLLQDLAGNAFATQSCASATILLGAFLGRCYRGRRGRLVDASISRPLLKRRSPSPSDSGQTSRRRRTSQEQVIQVCRECSETSSGIVRAALMRQCSHSDTESEVDVSSVLKS